MKTFRQHIKKLTKEQFLELGGMCRHTNSLYNQCLYEIKSYYRECNKYLSYVELYNKLKSSVHYKSIPAKIGQQIIRLADKNYRAFFALLRKKNVGHYAGKINEPKFRKPGDKYILILPHDQVSLIKNKLKITKNIRLPFSHPIDGKICQVIIKPNNNYYTIFISYEENKLTNEYNLNKQNHLSIDFGVNNLMSCFSTVGPSFIINGKPLKAYNQFYNKEKANIIGELETKNKKKWSNKLTKKEINRKNYIYNYFNQSVSIIQKYCMKHKIGNVIIGYNPEWKQDIHLGNRTNQKFGCIPYWILKHKLMFKLSEIGIDVTIHEESYTSKCSFLDDEPIKKHDVYLGKRVKRGLFKTNAGKLVNADINGAANIMKKVVSDVQKTKEIVGGIVRPLMLRNIFATQEAINLLK